MIQVMLANEMPFTSDYILTHIIEDYARSTKRQKEITHVELSIAYRVKTLNLLDYCTETIRRRVIIHFIFSLLCLEQNYLAINHYEELIPATRYQLTTIHPNKLQISPVIKMNKHTKAMT